MKAPDQFSIPDQSLFMVQKLVTGLNFEFVDEFSSVNDCLSASFRYSYTGQNFPVVRFILHSVVSVSKGFRRCTRSYLWIFRAEFSSATVSYAIIDCA